MTRANTAADRARARERTKIEAEQITGIAGLSQRVSDAVVRAHRNGDDPMSAVPSTSRATRQSTTTQRRNTGGSSTQKQSADLIPHVTIDFAPVPVSVPDNFGHLTEVQPIGAFLGVPGDLKLIRGSASISLQVTTSVEHRHLFADLAVISRGHKLAIVAYEIPRSVVFGDDERDDT